MARLLRLALLAAAAALALAGCSDDDTAGVVPLRMVDDAFSPEVVRIPEGGTIEVRNAGHNPHNAVAADDSWSTEETLGELAMREGDVARVTIDEPGVYPYYCTFHGDADGRGMAGVLVVGDVDDEELPGERTDAADAVAEPSGATRRVGGPDGDYDTIQDGVDAADPGDLVLIAPGVYREAVQVTTPSLVLRGADRNEVVVDAEFEHPNAVSVLEADGVAVENLTVRNAQLNGVVWTGVTGYRASYVTAYNNADYGIYAFDSVDGLFEHSYASGSPDAGFYIGQCDRCDAVITDVVAEHNALGYSGTNASGPLYIVRSTWRHNLAGIVPNTLDTELHPPVTGNTIAGNLVHDNDNLDVASKAFMRPLWGTGVALPGGSDHVVTRNRIVNHAQHGVLVAPSPDDRFWIPAGNRVTGNRIAGSGRADLALTAPVGAGNCFAANGDGAPATSLPPGLERWSACEGLRLPQGWDLSQTWQGLGAAASANHGNYPRAEVADMPTPPPQPQLPGGAQAPVRPAVDVFAAARPDLDAIALPDLPAELAVERASTWPLVAGAELVGATGWTPLLAWYGWLLLAGLLAVWPALALIDLAGRADLARVAGIGWALAAVALPGLGGAVYLLAGRPRLGRGLRLGVVLGGLLAAVAGLAALLLAGRVL